MIVRLYICILYIVSTLCLFCSYFFIKILDYLIQTNRRITCPFRRFIQQDDSMLQVRLSIFNQLVQNKNKQKNSVQGVRTKQIVGSYPPSIFLPLLYKFTYSYTYFFLFSLSQCFMQNFKQNEIEFCCCFCIIVIFIHKGKCRER